MSAVIKIAQITDFHLLENPQQSHYGAMPGKHFQQVIAYLHRYQTDFSAVVMTGDMVQDISAACYQQLDDYIQAYAWSIPFYWLLGNHDDYLLASTVFNKKPYIDSLQIQQLNLGKWQLCALNSQKNTADIDFSLAENKPLSRAAGEITAEQFKKSQQIIQSTKQDYVLLVLHHHLKPFNSFIDKHALKLPLTFEPWLARQHKVKGLIHGHVHAFKEYTFADKPCFSSGATSYQFGHDDDDFYIASTKPCFSLFSLLDDGEIKRERVIL